MRMLERLIRMSIEARWIVVSLTVLLAALGWWVTARTPVDVFPDLTAATITVITEAGRLAPEETELHVTRVVENALVGAPRVRRTRSISGYGFSVVWVEFSWGVPVPVARRIVGERLQATVSELPEGVEPPAISPESSVMGEIMTIGLHGEGVDPVVLREFAEREIRAILLRVPGVAQVFCSGGEVGQWHVVADPDALEAGGLGLEDLERSIAGAGGNSSAGYLVRRTQESMIRILGQVRTPADLEDLTVAVRGQVALPLGRLARIEPGVAERRGTGSINGRPGVVITVLRQPDANTLALTSRIQAVLDGVEGRLPAGATLERRLFSQADFIRTAVRNVGVSLRDGAILLCLILFLFMLDWRAILVSLSALPMSLVIAVLFLRWMGIEFNTMSLGGLTLAIGVLIDDAIIGVENTWRRLAINGGLPPERQKPVPQVVHAAMREILRSVVFANLLLVVVFVPIFFIGGMEGLLMAPLGWAFLSANVASLFVALTLVPALATFLAPRRPRTPEEHTVGSPTQRVLRRAYVFVLRPMLRHPVIILLAMLLICGFSAWGLSRQGRRFLPEWNEGALNITVLALPGTSLDESDALGREVERRLLTVPEVLSTSRKTGRTEQDEHAMDVNGSELEVRLARDGRPKETVVSEIRDKLSGVRGVQIQIGQPLAHRIDHMLSGSRTTFVVRVVGEDLYELRRLAREVAAHLGAISGVEDVTVEPVVEVNQEHLRLNRKEITEAGLEPRAVVRHLQIALQGVVAGTVPLPGGRHRDIFLRLRKDTDSWAGRIASLRIPSPLHGSVPLSRLVTVEQAMGPNLILHENGRRRILVTANFSVTDTAALVGRIQSGLDAAITLPAGYRLEYGGQFEAERRATRALLWIVGLVALTILLILAAAFRSAWKAGLLILNLPFALVGGQLALMVTGTPVSVASMLGFISLFGIAVRNGILLLEHYAQLLRERPGTPLFEVVTQGSMERMAPILMTALTSVFALVPLVWQAQAPGNEIQAPLAIVILGGMFSSTVLSLFVLPSLYLALASRLGDAGHVEHH
jgi:CzcA family heavy metal efflux pump